MLRADPPPGRAGEAEPELAVTEEVLTSFQGASSARFRMVMEALVRNLHSFIRETRLSEDEWRLAIEFLTRTGQITDEGRQEFILLSDVLGVSTLTVVVNQPADPAVTESTVLGPFFRADSPEVELGGDLAQGAPGQPCLVQGSVRGAGGERVAGARLEVWAADQDGLYDQQRDGPRSANRGHLFADAGGGFSFWTVRPTAYPIPTDGPVGDLLAAAGREAMRPAHLHFVVSAPGWRTLVTHLFVDGDPHLEHDAVFSVKNSLVVEFTEHRAGAMPPHGGPVEGSWSNVSYDFVLAPASPGHGPSAEEGKAR